MNERIQKLKEQIKELQAWKLSNSIQQIPFNPPVNTTKIMQEGMLVATGKVIDISVLPINNSIEVMFDTDKVLLPCIIQ